MFSFLIFLFNRNKVLHFQLKCTFQVCLVSCCQQQFCSSENHFFFLCPIYTPFFLVYSVTRLGLLELVNSTVKIILLGSRYLSPKVFQRQVVQPDHGIYNHNLRKESFYLFYQSYISAIILTTERTRLGLLELVNFLSANLILYLVSVTQSLSEMGGTVKLIYN